METRGIIIVLIVINVLMHSKSVQCIDIHIKASSNDHCLGSPCLMLSQISNAIASYTGDYNDIALIFDAGNHRLESPLTVANVTSFSMTANATSYSDHTVVITCVDYGRLLFIGVHNVYMNGLEFVGCIGNKIIDSAKQFTVEDSKFIGRNSFVPHPTGNSLIGIYGHTSAHFVRTSFEQNEFGTVIYAIVSRPTIQKKVKRKIVVGGAIYAEQSKIELVECSFERNKASIGGAIYVRNCSEITVIRSSFVNNHAKRLRPYRPYQPPHMGLGGGAIFADNTSLFIANSSFMHNIGQNGGAVSWTAKDGTVTIIGSNFTHNRAHESGGAIWWDTANTTISVINCIFVSNVVSIVDIRGDIRLGNGGALRIAATFNKTITIVSGNFFSNNSASDKSGGALLIDGSNKGTIIMSYNHFINNRASKQGGVLSFMSVHTSAEIILNDNVFKGNRALEGGGVFELNNANVKITRNNFTDNKANENGGVFSIVGSEITIIQSLFQYNTAERDGGVIASESSNVSISNSYIFSNRIEKDGHGGVIKAHQTSLAITETSIENNKANFGGVLWALLAEVNIYNVVVSGNSANTDGGVFHTEQSKFSIVEVTFNENRADNNGGIMKADRDRIRVVDCIFNHSIAGGDGGVIRTYLSEVNVSESTFISNRAGNDGGVYHIEQSNITISNQTYFTDNRAETGGVIWNDAGILSISQTSFTSNMASTGGVIWTDAGTAIVDRASFTDNKATTGAVMWMDRATISGNGIKAHKNYANYTTIYSLESIVEFTDALLSSNVGSLCAIESTVRLTDTVMTKMQTAVDQRNANQLEEGGAITAFQSNVIFDGANHFMHQKSKKGGAIHATEARLQIHGTVIAANNTASQDGGGIYLYQSELTCQRKSAL